MIHIRDAVRFELKSAGVELSQGQCLLMKWAGTVLQIHRLEQIPNIVHFIHE